jgi:hypothetical protein
MTAADRSLVGKLEVGPIQADEITWPAAYHFTMKRNWGSRDLATAAGARGGGKAAAVWVRKPMVERENNESWSPNSESGSSRDGELAIGAIGEATTIGAAAAVMGLGTRRGVDRGDGETWRPGFLRPCVARLSSRPLGFNWSASGSLPRLRITESGAIGMSQALGVRSWAALGAG